MSVHPSLEYALVLLNEQNEVLLLAADLVKDAMSRYGIEAYEVLGVAKGAAFGQLEGQAQAPFSVQHPFMPNAQGGAKFVPIITGTHVTADSGTGSVHTAPMHGADDFVVSNQFGVKAELMLVGNNGCFITTPVLDALELSGLALPTKAISAS